MADDAPDNVLFVVMDTVRKDHLSVYGYDLPTTPGLAAFAEEATVFEEAVAPAPWTLPVHASLFTGLYPSQHGASQENPYLEGATTLAESLSSTHATACYSSNAWITPYTRLTEGFDDQDNFFEVMPGEFLSGPIARAWKAMNDDERLRRVADWLVSVGNRFHEYFASGESADSKTPQAIDATQEFIADADERGEDFFAFVNLMDAHLPYHPPEEYREEFAPGVDPADVCRNSKEFNCGARDIDDDEWEAIEGLYDAEIRHIDAELRRLFDWLQSEGLWDDTMVVVCADHGELFGEHDLYGHEFSIYDPLVNVPLLVKHPALEADRREDQVELLDLYHTVLDTCGVAAEDATQPLDRSRSLLADDYREFARRPAGSDAVVGDGGHEGANERTTDADGTGAPTDGTDADDVSGRTPSDRASPDPDYAFVEYYRPVVELKQLEEKASAAGIDLPEDSRFYSRMRAARRPDAKYIRNGRIGDEGYRLDRDPGEREDLVEGGEGDDERVAAAERALAAFEERAGGEWKDREYDESEVLDDMGDDARERLQDLGYLE